MSENNPESETNKLAKLKELLSDKNSDILEIISLKNEITFENSNEEKEINTSIWEREYENIFPSSTNNNLLLSSNPTLNLITHLLSEVKEFSINDEEKISKLNKLNEEGISIQKEIKKAKNLEQLNSIKEKMKTINLNLSEFFKQKEIKIKNANLLGISLNSGTSSEEEEKKTKKITKKRKMRRKNEYENETEGEEESEKIDLSTHVIDLGKKMGMNKIKKEANELQEDIKNNTSTRSRRNIGRKKDNDFIYEDDIFDKKTKEENEMLLNEEENNNNKQKKSHIINDDNTDEDYIEEEKKEPKEKILLDDDILLNKKTKRKKNEKVKTIPPEEIKAKARKNALENLTKVLTDNKYLMEKGEDFVTNLSKNLEEELAKTYPKIDFEYQKTLTNMNKTLKEISNYKKINELVIKGKITLFKMAKFQYGDKFIKKIKKIEGGAEKKPPVQKNPNPSLDFNYLLQDSAELNEENTKKNLNKNKLNISKTNSGISRGAEFENDEYYNITQSNSYRSYSGRFDNDENNSLESIEDQENIKFSPGVNNKSSKDFNNGENLGNTYDPFNKDKFEIKYLFPILFDPVNENDSKENNNNMEIDNISNIINNNNNISENNENKIISIPPKGSVLRIYKGKIRLNHNILDDVSLYSTNQYQNFQKFPSFAEELNLPSKAKSNEVIPYCLKQLNNNSKLELYGWIEPNTDSEEEIEKFKDLINEFERNEKCSCLVDKKIKLYVFVISEKDGKFFEKVMYDCNFINYRVMQNLNNNNKFLVFVLLSNYDDLDNDIVLQKIKITPEIIKRIEINSETPKNSFKFKKSLSVITEEESSNIKDSTIVENNNNNNNMNEENNNNAEDDMYIDKEENEKLKNILEQDDFNAISDYFDKNFKGLAPDEMIIKIKRFTPETRDKLLELIKKFSGNFANDQMEVEENNNNNNNLQQMDMNQMNNMNMNNINNMQMNMYQNNANMNQMYLNQMNRMGMQQQGANVNNANSMNTMYYNQGINMYNNYNFK